MEGIALRRFKMIFKEAQASCQWVSPLCSRDHFTPSLVVSILLTVICREKVRYILSIIGFVESQSLLVTMDNNQINFF